jgi:hypothetical protein
VIPVSVYVQSYVVYLGRQSYASEPSTTDLDRVTDAHHELLGSCMKRWCSAENFRSVINGVFGCSNTDDQVWIRYDSKEKAKQAIFYSYTRYINGFAAILEDEEAAEISSIYNTIIIVQHVCRAILDNITNMVLLIRFQSIQKLYQFLETE